ncbi:hypothetical protein Tco_0881883 [Tanacetum coccineum]
MGNIHGINDAIKVTLFDVINIRDEIGSSVWYKVGNGKNTSLWFDNWCDLGPLFRIISNRSLYSASLQRNMMVADMVSNDKWNWPTEWNSMYPNIMQIPIPNIDVEKNDWIVWKNKDSKNKIWRGKDSSNPFMVDNLPKIVGFLTHLASLVKSWLVQDQTVLALASPKANELIIPEQTATGKGTSNPLMAGSLPKTTKPT